MACFCFLKNVVDLLDDDKTAYKRRFASDFSGPLIPFGAEVSYLPITDKDKARTHQFGSKMLLGIFLGYDQQEGGGWSGDLLLLDWEELEHADHFSDVHIKRFKAAEVTAIKIGTLFRFPLAEGVLSQPDSSRRQSPRRRRDSSNSSGAPGGEAEDPADDGEDPFPGGTEKGLDSDEEAESSDDSPSSGADAPASEDLDFWTVNDDVVIRHHRTPRTKLYVPEESTFPIPLKYLDILRRTCTDISDKAESQINDYWPESGARELSSEWVGKTVFA